MFSVFTAEERKRLLEVEDNGPVRDFLLKTLRLVVPLAETAVDGRSSEGYENNNNNEDDDDDSDDNANSQRSPAPPQHPHHNPRYSMNNNQQKKKKARDVPQFRLVVRQLRVRDDPDTAWRIMLALCSHAHILAERPRVFRNLLNSIFQLHQQQHQTKNSNNTVCEMREKIFAAQLQLIAQLVACSALLFAPACQLLVQYLARAPIVNDAAAATAAAAGTTTTAAAVDDAAEAAHNAVLQREMEFLHRLLRFLLAIAPAGRAVLLDALAEYLPHKRRPLQQQQHYAAQLLRVCSYAPLLRGQLLQLLLRHCLEMDVEIVIDDCGHVSVNAAVDQQQQQQSKQQEVTVENGDEEAPQQQFQMDADFDTVPAPTTTAAAAVEGNAQVPSAVAMTASKLDALLVLLVDFCDRELATLSVNIDCSSGNQQQVVKKSKRRSVAAAVDFNDGIHSEFGMQHNSSSSELDRLIQQLLQAFENCLLPTHKSKFVQFVLFSAAAKCPQFARQFCVRCLQLSTRRADASSAAAAADFTGSLMRHGSNISSSNSNSNSRTSSSGKSALMYLSSFIARARFLPLQFVSEILHELLQWAVRYAVAADAATTTTTAATAAAAAVSDFDEFGRAVLCSEKRSAFAQHELFYSAVQACCYCFCFHGVPLVDCTAAITSTTTTSATTSTTSTTSAATIVEDGREQLQRSWQKLILCSLDPLQFCLPAVTAEFLKLAKHCALLPSNAINRLHMYAAATTTTATAARDSHCELPLQSQGNCCDDAATDIESTAHSVHHQQHQQQQQGSGSNSSNSNSSSYSGSNYNNNSSNGSSSFLLLDPFFPFDPCLLYQLQQRVEGAYQQWQGVPGVPDHSSNYTAAARATTADGECYEDEEEEEEENCYDDYDNATAEETDAHMQQQQQCSSPASSLAFTDAGSAMSIASTIGDTTLYQQQQQHQLQQHMPQHVATITAATFADENFSDDDAVDGDERDDYVVHSSCQQQQPLTADSLRRAAVAVSCSSRQRRYSIGSNGSW